MTVVDDVSIQKVERLHRRVEVQYLFLLMVVASTIVLVLLSYILTSTR